MSSILATWLQGAMDAYGMDARRLAQKLGVSEGAVHNWLYEGAIPGMKNLVELSRLFNISTETLIKDIAGFDIIPSRTPEERERRRAEALARLPRFAEIAEKIAKLSPAKQDAYLGVIEKMVPEDET